MIAKFGARLYVSLLCAGLAWTLAGVTLVVPGLLTAQEQVPATKKPKNRVLTWDPPQVDSRLHPLASGPPCILSGVLNQSAERANALFDGLKSFTAREEIQFKKSTLWGDPEDEFTRIYDYLASFKQGPAGLVMQDSRSSRGGRKLQMSFDQDLGLPELSLIFLPGMQGDYDFKCDGATQWNGQPAFVVSFRQRKDRARRTVSFRGDHGAYPASIRGRAWIAIESGEVQHIETISMEPIPEVGVRNWSLSIDYAPVVFPAKNVRMILAKTVAAYCEFPDSRTIAYHTFTEFKLFGAEVTMTPAGPSEQ